MNDAARPDPREELVDHLDGQGRVIEVVTRAEMRSRVLRHRAVFIAVIDSGGRLLAHQRAADKDLWPSRWDIAAGGVVAAGETWDAAAERELAEELGVRTTLTNLGSGSFADGDVSVVGRVYVAHHDGPVSFDDGEVVSARWVDSSELDALLVTAPMCPDSVALVLPLVRPLMVAPRSAT